VEPEETKLGKHVPLTRNMHATVGQLLDTVSSLVVHTEAT
jgi:hypothetical protein